MVDTGGAMQGAVDLGDGLTPIDIWQGLHANARSWADVPYGASQQQDRMLIDGTDLGVLKALASYPAEKWSALCEAVGWTVYGAVGISWCKGANLSQVWAGWEASGVKLKPMPDQERPARFINSALLPQSRKVSDLIEASSPSELAFCAMVASSSEPLDFGKSAGGYQAAPAQIAAFLKSRMLQKANRTPKEDALLQVWSQKVNGTEFDAWAEDRT